MYVLDAFEDIRKALYGGVAEFLFNTEQTVINQFKTFNLYGDNFIFWGVSLRTPSPRWRWIPALSRLQSWGGTVFFYDSYQDLLYYTYEKVPVGGIVIFDDIMGHAARSCSVGWTSRPIVDSRKTWIASISIPHGSARKQKLSLTGPKWGPHRMSTNWLTQNPLRSSMLMSRKPISEKVSYIQHGASERKTAIS